MIASPAVLFEILRLRPIAPVHQPDPAMHSTFIFDPQAIFLRYPPPLSPLVLGDSARVGFLVPGRVFYLLFGAMPGFFVYRYVLALIAIVPVYLLLRKLYGRWAGWVGIVVIMSSSVVVTTWGSDYSSSAAISYMTGGLAALALSWEERRWAKVWLLGAGCLFTMAVWSNGVCFLLVGATLVSYLGLRLVRDRPQLGWDVLALGLALALTTGALALCSEWLLGWSNFISLSIELGQYLNSPHQVALYHSASWAWAPYDTYLLIPPAIVVSFFLMFIRRAGMSSSLLFVGIAGGLQLVVLAYLQILRTSLGSGDAPVLLPAVVVDQLDARLYSLRRSEGLDPAAGYGPRPERPPSNRDRLPSTPNTRIECAGTAGPGRAHGVRSEPERPSADLGSLGFRSGADSNRRDWNRSTNSQLEQSGRQTWVDSSSRVDESDRSGSRGGDLRHRLDPYRGPRGRPPHPSQHESLQHAR